MGRWWLGPVLVVGLLANAGCGGECDYDTDCPDTQVCSKRTCVDPDLVTQGLRLCDTGADCATSEVCLDRRCIDARIAAELGTGLDPGSSGGSGGGSGDHSLVLSGSGFNRYDGRTMIVSVETTSDGTRTDLDRDRIQNGTFQVNMRGALEDGRGHGIYYYADVDADGRCDDTDPGWSAGVGDATRDRTVRVSYRTPRNVCSHF